MTLDEAQKMILGGFAYMNRDQRKAILQFLKLSKPKLDFSYPNGVPYQEPEAKPEGPSLILPNQ